MHQRQISLCHAAQFLTLNPRFKMHVKMSQLGVFFVPLFLKNENNNQHIVLS